VLLAFDLIAAALFVSTPRLVESLGRRLSGASRRPVAFFGLLVVVSALVYVPMALAFNPFRWTAFGPFFFQTSRILHYLVYFLIAAGMGAYGLKLGLLDPNGRLARKWALWLGTALLLFGVAAAVGIGALTAKGSFELWTTIASVGFSLSCAASSFAFLALFLRFVKVPRPVFDSLRDNAYGMYLIHYAFVSWLQYAVLKVRTSAPLKGLTVFLGTLLISWSVTAALRRIPAIRRII
jgi:peptidoglycan/LPS O-acetylase OafA/YrhL